MKGKPETVFAGIFAVLFSWIGILIIPVLALIAFNILDYVTRFIAVKANGGKIESKKSIGGIYKKAGMWCLIAACAVVDLVLVYCVEFIGIALPFKFIIATIVAIWLVFNEFISILENISYGGTKFPDFVVKFANKVLGKMETKGQEIVDTVDKEE